MNDNILRVSFNGSKNVMSNSLWQYDYGQIMLIKGISLPSLYEVHFSKDKTGTAVTAVGTADGVAIPDKLLETTGEIYAWIYLHTDESDGETKYQIKIPVIGRAKPTHEEPTPVQQTEIEQLIATLENLIENYGGGSGGGADGVSPTVTITEITGGHRVTITDKNHPSGQSFDVLNGEKGDRGEQGIQGIQGERGSDGADGKDGKDGINGTDGKDGSDGVSPTISVTEITGGHTVTITDAEHPQGISFNVMDGANGQNGQDGADGSNYVLTAQDKSDIADLVLAQIPYAEGVGF